MNNSLELIDREIAECVRRIEEYQHEIGRLRKMIRELSWQVVEVDEGEITHYDDEA